MTNFSKPLPVITTIAVIVFLSIFCSPLLGYDYQNERHLYNAQSQREATIGLLQNQELHAIYEDGLLELEITGAPLIGLGLLNTQQFVYRLPPPFEFILQHPHLKNVAKIDFQANLLLGIPITDQILGEDLEVDSLLGTITGERFSVLNLSLLSTLHVTLTIDLDSLGVDKLPPSSNGLLTFYGLAAKDGLIDLGILISEGATAILETDVLDVTPPDPPIVEPVTDVDTVVSGYGEPFAEVTVTTEDDGKYYGVVDSQGRFTVNIPLQKAETKINVTLTDAGNNQSNPTIVVVIGVRLELFVPEQLVFQKTPIGVHEIIILRENQFFELIVNDTRGVGSKWKVTAKVDEPLSTIDGSTLGIDSLIYINETEEQLLKDGVLIYEGITQTESPTSIYWGANEGVLLRLNPLEATPNVKYTTTIYWTLVDAP